MFENASAPIELIPSGRFISLRAVKSLNAFSAISVVSVSVKLSNTSVLASNTAPRVVVISGTVKETRFFASVKTAFSNSPSVTNKILRLVTAISDTTNAGRDAQVIFSQPRKAPAPNSISLFSIDISSSPVQFWKALLPMLSMLFGIFNEAIPVCPQNALAAIALTDLPS